MMALSDGVRVFLHSLLGFCGVVLAARLLGQNLTTMIGVAVAVVAGVASIAHEQPWTDWLIASITWVGLTLLVQWIAIYSTSFATLLGKQPTPVIQGGKVLEGNLRKSRVSVTQLLSMMREKNAFAFSDVELGIIEPDGQMSVLLKSEKQPITPSDANLPVENQAGPVSVIVDGQVQNPGLAQLHVGRSWIGDQLRKRGISDLKDVVLAQVDGKGHLTVDLREDAYTPPLSRSVSKPGVLATLKKAQADMEAFCLETQNQEAKKLYALNAARLQNVIAMTEPFLLHPETPVQ